MCLLGTVHPVAGEAAGPSLPKAALAICAWPLVRHVWESSVVVAVCTCIRSSISTHGFMVLPATQAQSPGLLFASVPSHFPRIASPGRLSFYALAWVLSCLLLIMPLGQTFSPVPWSTAVDSNWPPFLPSLPLQSIPAP